MPTNKTSAKRTTPVRAEPLSYAQLEALPDDTVVWIKYTKSGESSARINQAARIKKEGTGQWEFFKLNSESHIADMLRESSTTDSELAIQYCRGEFQVFSTVLNKERKVPFTKKPKPLETLSCLRPTSDNWYPNVAGDQLAGNVQVSLMRPDKAKPLEHRVVVCGDDDMMMEYEGPYAEQKYKQLIALNDVTRKAAKAIGLVPG